MTKVREQVTQIFDQEMDRKHFLQFSAGIFLAAFGVTGLINAILSNGKKPKAVAQANPNATAKRGYGSARFGN